MRKAIFAWYNALREEWGLERIGEEPEETAELVLEDFRFRAAEASDTTQSQELHLLCVEEFLMGHGGGDSRDWPEAIQAERKARWRFPAEIAWVAETGQGDFAGYLCAQRDGTAIRILALDVKAEYRGLGIGEALLLRLLDNLDQTLVSHVLVDLPAFSDGFSRVLLREGFHPYETRYTVDLKKRLPST
jgi:GNAT superfamily N-acetyltransferase